MSPPDQEESDDKYLSAYIPCYNNQHTIARTLRSLQCQSLPLNELYIVDDGSTDDSVFVAEQLGVPVVRLPSNQGRGAVRGLGIERAQHDLVLCCDATNELPPDFLANAFHWFENPCVAAVFGRIQDTELRCFVDRWRARHLFKMWKPYAIQYGALLATGGCVLRRSLVRAVGNFNASLRHSEDIELGRRLLAAGYDVIFDPSLSVISLVSDTPLGVLDRYWRWNAGEAETISWKGYFRLIWYSLRVQVSHDLRDRDFACIWLSLLCPHYQFWKSWWRLVTRRVQR